MCDCPPILRDLENIMACLQQCTYIQPYFAIYLEPNVASLLTRALTYRHEDNNVILGLHVLILGLDRRLLEQNTGTTHT